MKFEHLDQSKKYIDTAERLLKSIKDYKIAVVKIGDMTIDEVAPIFERINSTGRKLTIVDLMMAATWSDGFDLSREITKIKKICYIAGFPDIPDQLVLRSIAAAAGLGINKEDIQKLRSKDANSLKQAALEAGNSLEQALTYLINKINIRDLSYIPYGMQLTHIAEFFRTCQTPSDKQISELTRWFWATSTTRYFGGASTGQNSKDLKAVRDFASGIIATLFNEESIDISQLLYDTFNLKNATSTTFTLLLNHFDPKSTLDNRPIDGSHLKTKSSKLFSSLFPEDASVAKMNISRVINPYPDNINLDLATNKTEYFKHLIDEACISSCRSGDRSKFLSVRANIIAERVASLTACKVTYMPPNLSYLKPNNTTDYEDSDLLE